MQITETTQTQYTMMSEVDGIEVGLVIVDGTRESSLRSTTSSFYRLVSFISDTVGMTSYNQKSKRGASLVIICFDITNTMSFNDIRGELEDAERFSSI